MQQQQPPASKHPLTAITTEQIQKYLEDNKNLIMAILEYQKLGRFQECAQYQAVLQKNLMYLAAIADAQPQTPQTPNPSQASSSFSLPPTSIPQASNFIQQPGGSSGGQKLSFQQQQDQQQQFLHFQQQRQQQQFQTQMGLRSGAQNGVFGVQSMFMANPSSRQGGSEAVFGGDGGGMFFNNGSFRD